MAIFSKEKLRKIKAKLNRVEKKHCILIVDDEEANLRVLSELLAPEYNILLAKDGREALDLVVRESMPERIHVILSDQRMPHMSGTDFLEQTIPLIPRTKRIILTGFIDINVIIASINQAQIYKFLLKPFDPQQMLLTVKRAVEAYELEEQNIELTQKLQDLNSKLEEKVQLRTQELEQKNRLIEKQRNESRELLHILCHDLANPIGSVFGFVKLLRKRPAKLVNYINIMERGLQNALDLIEIVRKLRSLEDRKQNLEINSFQLLLLIEEAASLLQHRFTQKAIKLEINIDPELEVLVEKTSFINSIINNLFTNAIKFSKPNSEIKVRIDSHNSLILLIIRDFGIGMSPHTLDALFDLEKSYSRLGTDGETGTGFGIPLVKKFIEFYGGRIEIFSQEESTPTFKQGTEIRLYLIPGPLQEG
ncbi:MAG: hypothetical protein COB67_10995 [SAR324 cluster bacterium]|uniref:histidine kinase n=1 Tax=SAR324 cluster bacterium TaxID=2024889 RepID=A0A2A4SWP6_9DELT|nr:MAG: hypothetical protein COB67_10995 [SAR324 cluster bacterium]